MLLYFYESKRGHSDFDPSLRCHEVSCASLYHSKPLPPGLPRAVVSGCVDSMLGCDLFSACMFCSTILV